MAKGKGCGRRGGCSNKITYTRQRTRRSYNNEESDPVAPDIIVSITNYDYGNVKVGESKISTYNVSAVGLTGDLYINNTNPNSEVSKDGGLTWAANFYISPDINGEIATMAIKARFTPAGEGDDEGFISHVAAGATTEYIDWIGAGVVPIDLYNENFQGGGNYFPPNYKFPAGWIDPPSPYNPVNEWACYFDAGIFYPLSPGSGGRSLIFANNGFAVNRTTTKRFSTAGFGSITIDMLQYRKTGSPTMMIEWSTDNSTWNDAGLVNVTDDEAWHAAAQMSLPVGAENQPWIYIRLSATADDGGASDIYFALDDLIVKGTYL